MCLGVPGKIIEIDFGGVIREACIETLPEAQVGDYTIIHAGFALNILSEEEANLTLEALRELADINEELNVGGQEDFTGYEVK
jgi:hydrogenase expression/formation protein HypC